MLESEVKCIQQFALHHFPTSIKLGLELVIPISQVGSIFRLWGLSSSSPSQLVPLIITHTHTQCKRKNKQVRDSKMFLGLVKEIGRKLEWDQASNHEWLRLQLKEVVGIMCLGIQQDSWGCPKLDKSVSYLPLSVLFTSPPSFHFLQGLSQSSLIWFIKPNVNHTY